MIQRFYSTTEYIPRKGYPVDYIKREYKTKKTEQKQKVKKKKSFKVKPH